MEAIQKVKYYGCYVFGMWWCWKQFTNNYMKMIQTAFKFQFSIKKYVLDNNDFALNLVQFSSNVVTVVNK